jgi:hypothetical protein
MNFPALRLSPVLMKSRFSPFVFLVPFLLFLAACGGGSSSSDEPQRVTKTLSCTDWLSVKTPVN